MTNLSLTKDEKKSMKALHDVFIDEQDVEKIESVKDIKIDQMVKKFFPSADAARQMMIAKRLTMRIWKSCWILNGPHPGEFGKAAV